MNFRYALHVEFQVAFLHVELYRFKAWKYYLLVHLFKNWHWCFQFGASVNSNNIHILFVWIYWVSLFWGKYPGGTCWSHGKHMFDFVSMLHTVFFQSVCTILHFTSVWEFVFHILVIGSGVVFQPFLRHGMVSDVGFQLHFPGN